MEDMTQNSVVSETSVGIMLSQQSFLLTWMSVSDVRLWIGFLSKERSMADALSVSDVTLTPQCVMDEGSDEEV